MEEKGIHYRIGGNLTHCGCECLPGGKDIEYIVIEKIDYVAETRLMAGQNRMFGLQLLQKILIPSYLWFLILLTEKGLQNSTQIAKDISTCLKIFQ